MTNLAVILSARKDKTTEIPFPLLPYDNGQCLIDRTLSLAKEAGISRIILVVGYKAELFEKYRNETVQIVQASNYEFSASMSSLADARDFIDEDFILIEGDTFFEKKALEQLNRVKDGNCLVVTEESGSGDECFIESKAGFITKISKDRHRICRFEGELLGISRISKETYVSMLREWDMSANSYLNYEHVLMDVTSPLDRPFIFIKNLIWGDVDCPEDFKRLKEVTYRTLRRKEDPFDKDNLLKYLTDIFPGEDVGQTEIIQIGGMSNKNFRVDYQGRSYVLRVPGNGSEGMVVRSFEEFNSIEGSKMGINPPVRYFNAGTGIKLVDFVEDAETLNSATIQRPDNMKKIASIYRTLHHSRVRLRNEFNVFREIEKYDVLLERANAKMYEGWEYARGRVMALEPLLNDLGVELHPCHNDAVPENFLKAKDGKIYLIDWEYSGMNDPMADFAALFLESNFTSENQDYMLVHYFDGEIPENTMLRILCYQVLWDYLWAQWTVIKEAQGDDFGNYGFDRYNRAIGNLKIVEKLQHLN